MVEKSDLRAVLQYIPQFRGNIFCVLIEAGLLPEPAVAETLLDLAVLERLGVKLVLGVLGGDLADLYDWTLECEIKAARVVKPLADPSAADEVLQVLNRGQSAIVDASGLQALDPVVVNFAREIRVSKLIALLEDPILINGQPALAISAAEVPETIQTQDVARPDLLKAAADACVQGIPRVHVLNGRHQGVLVDELFSNEGVGTMVHADSYRIIRELREDDIPELLSMIGRVVRRTKLVPRTYEDIHNRISDYRVMTIDNNVVGCVALHQYESEVCGEIACLYVKQAHEGRGYGYELVSYAEKIAQSLAIPRLFALTTRAADFFTRAGYTRANSSALPILRLNQHIQSGRDSLVFEKIFT